VINRFERFRRIAAVRYEKLAISYLAMVTIASVRNDCEFAITPCCGL
jgi:hypothetical protein